MRSAGGGSRRAPELVFGSAWFLRVAETRWFGWGHLILQLLQAALLRGFLSLLPHLHPSVSVVTRYSSLPAMAEAASHSHHLSSDSELIENRKSRARSLQMSVRRLQLRESACKQRGHNHNLIITGARCWTAEGLEAEGTCSLQAGEARPRRHEYRCARADLV